MRSLRTAAAVIAATGLVLAGCGSSSESSTEESAAASSQTAAEADGESPEETAEEVVEEAAEETVPDDVQESEAEIPYFYDYGCEGAAVTLLDMAAYFSEFDPTDASSDDAATFRAMGEAMIATANLPEEGAMGEGVTTADTAIYSAGIGAIDLADVIDNAGFTMEIEEATAIFAEDADRAVTECGLE